MLRNHAGIGKFLATKERNLATVVLSAFYDSDGDLDKAVQAFNDNIDLINDDTIHNVVDNYAEQWAESWSRQIIQYKGHHVAPVARVTKAMKAQEPAPEHVKEWFGVNTKTGHREQANVRAVLLTSKNGKQYTQFQLRSQKTGRVLKQTKAFKDEIKRRQESL